MKPAIKLKELDSHLYYTLLEYKDRYRSDYDALFSRKSLNTLSREALILWIGFVSGKQHVEQKEIIYKL